jgi:hypothetical protein
LGWRRTVGHPKARQNPTVLPFASPPSPGRLPLPHKGTASTFQGQDLVLRARSQFLPGHPVRKSTAKTPACGWARSVFGVTFNVVNSPCQENRWHHHDRLARTGDLGGSCARSLRSFRRPQEPPVSNDLALAFSAAAGNQDDGSSTGGRERCQAEVNRSLRATRADEKSKALSPGRQPFVLVLDDPGCIGGRRNHRWSNHRRERDRPRPFALRNVSIHAPARPERVVHKVTAQTL